MFVEVIEGKELDGGHVISGLSIICKEGTTYPGLFALRVNRRPVDVYLGCWLERTYAHGRVQLGGGGGKVEV